MDKIVLYLMNKKGLSVLQGIIASKLHHRIIYVVTNRDNSIENDYYNDICELCRKHDLKKYERNEIHPVHKGYSFAIGWRWLIEENQNLIVFHDSLLPKNRGFNPLVTSLICGDKEIGVTALFANKEFDQGDTISQKKITIEYPIRISEAIEKVSMLYVELAIELINEISSENQLPRKPQNDLEASYSIWRDEEDYRIDWSDEAEKIKRHVDATGFPYNGASSVVEGKLVRILDVEIVKDLIISNRTPGKVIMKDGTYPIVLCGKGMLKITKGHYEESKDSIFPLKKFRLRFI